MSDPATRRGLATAVLAALAAQTPVVPARSAERGAQQQADDDAHEAALVAVDATTRQIRARIRMMTDAEMDALDAVTLAAILESVTPAEDASLEAWRAQMDADLAQAPDQLRALQSEIDALLQTTEARLDGTSYDEEETEEARMKTAVKRQRMPLDQAQALTADRLTVLRRYIYSFLRLNWVGYAAPAKITAVDLPGQLATVALSDGSGLTVDGVEYGSGTPQVDAATVLYLPVRAPRDPAGGHARPVPAGRAWITVPGGARWLYYWDDRADFVARIPWPPANAAVAPELLFHPRADSGDWTVGVSGPPGSFQMLRFLGFDGTGTAYMSGWDSGGSIGTLWRWRDYGRGGFQGRQTYNTPPVPLDPYTPTPTLFMGADSTPDARNLIGYWSQSWGGHPPMVAGGAGVEGPGGIDQHWIVSRDGGATFSDYRTDHYHLYTVRHATTPVEGWFSDYGPDASRAVGPYFNTMAGWAIWTTRDGEGSPGQIQGWGYGQRYYAAGPLSENLVLITMDGALLDLPLVGGVTVGDVWAGGPAGDGKWAAAQSAFTSVGGGRSMAFSLTHDVRAGNWVPLGIPTGQDGYFFGADRALARLLALDSAQVAWYSEDGGATWTRAEYQALGQYPRAPSGRIDWYRTYILEAG